MTPFNRKPAYFRFLRIILIWTGGVLLGLSCEKQSTPVQPSNPQLTLAAEAGVIEAWLTLTTGEAEGMELLLTRDGAERLRFSAVAETTVVDTGLQPARGYSYTALLRQNGQTVKQASASLTTMDTTSHDFQWEIFEFGGVRGSSVLYDVAIVNENDIWAVGEIHTAETDTFDSLGNWVPPYSAVHWNGQEWELKHFFYQNNSGGQSIIIPVRGIWVFAPGDIWLAAGSIFHWTGNLAELSYSRNIGTSETVEKLWANSPDDIYGVGNVGLIVHYTGQGWQQIYTGLNLPVQDIWGAIDPKTGEMDILAPASEKYYSNEKKLLKIDSKTKRISLIDWPYPNRRIHSVWFKNFSSFWICGAGVFVNRYNNWKEFTVLPLIFTNRIRGRDSNDIFVAGDFGMVAHYNGLSWKIYLEVNLPLYESLDYSEHLMVAVGHRNGRAYILRMER